MSIKTFPYRPFGGNDNLLIFLVISVLLHLVFALGLVSVSSVVRRADIREKAPVVVDVVDLPPGPSSTAPPRNFRYYSDRNQTVQKETFPESSKGRALRSIPAPIAGTKGNGKEALQSPPKAAAGEEKKTKAPSAQKSAPAKKEEAAKVPPKASLADARVDDSYGVKKAEKSVKETPASEARSVAGPQGKGAEAPFGEALPKPQDNGQGRGAGTKGGAAAKPARPDLFPTPERITELEKHYEADSPKGEKGKTLQLNTSELRYQKYLMNMKNRIEFYWEYPEVAARSGWQGDLFINFTINKDGTVSNITVLKSSGYPVLDDAAVTGIRLASPFPPFPDNFGIEEINIKGQFEYKIYGGPHGG